MRWDTASRSCMLTLPMRCAPPPTCHAQGGGAAHSLAVGTGTRRQTIWTCCVVRLLVQFLLSGSCRPAEASSNPSAACLRVMQVRPMHTLSPARGGSGGGPAQHKSPLQFTPHSRCHCREGLRGRQRHSRWRGSPEGCRLCSVRRLITPVCSRCIPAGPAGLTSSPAAAELSGWPAGGSLPPSSRIIWP